MCTWERGLALHRGPHRRVLGGRVLGSEDAAVGRQGFPCPWDTSSMGAEETE